MTIDELMTPVNLMLAPFCNPRLIPHYENASLESLRTVIDTIVDGLRGEEEAETESVAVPMKLAS